MTNELSPPLPTPSPALTEGRLGLRALAVDIVRRPAEAFHRLAEQPGRRWIWPLVALMLLATAAELAKVNTAQFKLIQSQAMSASMEAASARNPGMSSTAVSGQQIEGIASTFTLVSIVIGTPIGILVATLLVAATMHLVSTLLGGQQTFSTVFTTTAWARVPLILRAAVQLLAALGGQYDPNPHGLAGLVARNPTDIAAKPSFLAPLLGQIELWNLWTLVLYVVMLMVVAQVGWRKALVGAVVLVVLQVLLGMAGVALAGALVGLSGAG